MADKKPNKLNMLSNVKVVSVGLVPRGANQEDFFLLKSDEEDNSMKDIQDATQTQDAPVVSEDVLKKEEVSWLRGLMNKFTKPEDIPAAKEPEATPEPEPVVKTDVEPDQTPSEPDWKSEFEKIAKAQETLVDRLEKAEADAAKERDARERIDFVQKAAVFNKMPVAAEKLADELMFLSKGGKDHYDFWYGLLSAVDKTLKDGNIFVEIGKSSDNTIPAVKNYEDIVELAKNGEPKDIREALLKLGKREGDSYLKSRRARAKED